MWSSGPLVLWVMSPSLLQNAQADGENGIILLLRFPTRVDHDEPGIDSVHRSWLVACETSPLNRTW
jgi:hypothetical protein